MAQEKPAQQHPAAKHPDYFENLIWKEGLFSQHASRQIVQAAVVQCSGLGSTLLTMPAFGTKQQLVHLLPAFLVEITSIILGIVLGLGVNEWREGRKDQQLVAQALQNIEQEMALNAGLVREHRRYHVELSQAFDRLLAAAGATRTLKPGQVDRVWQRYGKGTYPYVPYSIAWETAVDSQAANHMDYAVRLQFASVYKLQESALRAQQQLGELLFEPRMFENGNVYFLIAAAQSRFANLLNRESELLSAYKRAALAEAKR